MRSINRVKIAKVKVLHSPPWDVPSGYAELPPEQQADIARSLAAQPKEILQALDELGPISLDEHRRTLVEAYRALTLEEGRQLASDVIALSTSDTEMGLADLDEVLLHLACLVPGALTGVHEALVEDYYHFPFEIFREADAETRDRLIKLAETQHHDTALRTLAWIDDDEVRSTFHRWRQSPPVSDPDLASKIKWYAKDAGWELTTTGERRLLYHPVCYGLLPVNQVTPEDLPGPVGVVLPHDERCGLCDRQLITLFDIDVSDPRLSFLAPGWDRLRIATCEQCLGFDTVVSTVDGQGGSHPMESEIKQVGAAVTAWDLPQRRLALGPQRRSAYEAHQYILYLNDHASQLGGFPMWVGQEPHPDCPTCDRAMVFVGQLSVDDLFDDGAEGVIYAFLCQDCRLAATTYAQT